jgi:hypothetical protein
MLLKMRKEEVDEPFDLYHSYVQGLLSHGRQLLKRDKIANKKQTRAHKKQTESKTADERVLWSIPWALSAVGGESGSVARFVGENEVNSTCKDPLICFLKSRLQALIYP